MSKSLVFNGKEYIPSATLATEHGYSSDYISKLAREEKILGTQIGRQWFVEPGSLKIFFAQAATEKKFRTQALRTQRRMERLTNEAILKQKAAKETQRYALIESVAVCMCVAFVCLLGWTTFDSNIRSSDFLAGTYYAAEVLVEGIAPSSPKVASSAGSTMLFDVAAENKIVHSYAPTSEELTGHFTILPNKQTRDAYGHITTLFSDEVTVDEIDGEVYVTPIFKNDEHDGMPIKITESNQP